MTLTECDPASQLLDSLQAASSSRRSARLDSTDIRHTRHDGSKDAEKARNCRERVSRTAAGGTRKRRGNDQETTLGTRRGIKNAKEEQRRVSPSYQARGFDDSFVQTRRRHEIASSRADTATKRARTIVGSFGRRKESSRRRRSRARETGGRVAS